MKNSLPILIVTGLPVSIGLRFPELVDRAPLHPSAKREINLATIVYKFNSVLDGQRVLPVYRRCTSQYASYSKRIYLDEHAVPGHPQNRYYVTLLSCNHFCRGGAAVGQL